MPLRHYSKFMKCFSPDAIRWKITGIASVVIKTSSLLSELDTYVLSVKKKNRRKKERQIQLCILARIHSNRWENSLQNKGCEPPSTQDKRCEMKCQLRPLGSLWFCKPERAELPLHPALPKRSISQDSTNVKYNCVLSVYMIHNISYTTYIECRFNWYVTQVENNYK